MGYDTRVVAFTGYKGSGKDSAASILIDHSSFVRTPQAGALKAMLAALFAYQGQPATLANIYLEGELKETPTDLLAGRTPRYAMQTLGTEWGRVLMPEDFWTDVNINRIMELNTNCVITDIRFVSEEMRLRQIFGDRIRFVRIDRPGHVASDHASEQQIHLIKADAILSNEYALLKSWQDYIKHLVKTGFFGDSLFE